jgi:hypothetical protein
MAAASTMRGKIIEGALFGGIAYWVGKKTQQTGLPSALHAIIYYLASQALRISVLPHVQKNKQLYEPLYLASVQLLAPSMTAVFCRITRSRLQFLDYVIAYGINLLSLRVSSVILFAYEALDAYRNPVPPSPPAQTAN